VSHDRASGQATYARRWRAAPLLLGTALCSALPSLAFAAACALSVGALDFGAYDVFSTSDLAANAGIVVSCRSVPGDPSPVLVGYQVALSAGVGNSFTQRKMANGAHQLGYNLYTTNGYAQVWGDGTGSTRTVGGTFLLGAPGSARNRTHTVYGRTPAQQDVAVGRYADSLLVVVNF
jgi:spore coat protein U-like protein